MRHQVALSLVCLAVLAMPAVAQQVAGDTELQAQATLSLSTSGGKNNSGGVNLNAGRFLTDRQEVGGLVSATITTDNKFAGYGGPFYRYNFGTGQIVPYVGAAATASFGSFGNGKGGLLTFEGGVRYFVDRKTAFTVEGSTFYSFDQKEFSKTLLVLFGFSHLWGK